MGRCYIFSGLLIEIGYEEFSGGTAGVLDIFNGVNTSPYGLDGNGPE
jgi:hypothetical protein